RIAGRTARALSDSEGAIAVAAPLQVSAAIAAGEGRIRPRAAVTHRSPQVGRASLPVLANADGQGRPSYSDFKPQSSSSKRSGDSTHSLTRTRKLTASRPSMSR